MHMYTPPKSVSDGPVTNLFSILCILIEIFSRVHAKVGGGSGGGRIFNDFKLGTLIGRFSNDGVAVKGLNAFWQCVHWKNSRKVSIGTAGSSFFTNLSMGLATVLFVGRQQQIRGN